MTWGCPYRLDREDHCIKVALIFKAVKLLVVEERKLGSMREKKKK
jgi:hypothetical protein